MQSLKEREIFVDSFESRSQSGLYFVTSKATRVPEGFPHPVLHSTRLVDAPRGGQSFEPGIYHRVRLDVVVRFVEDVLCGSSLIVFEISGVGVVVHAGARPGSVKARAAGVLPRMVSCVVMPLGRGDATGKELQACFDCIQVGAFEYSLFSEAYTGLSALSAGSVSDALMAVASETHHQKIIRPKKPRFKQRDDAPPYELLSHPHEGVVVVLSEKVFERITLRDIAEKFAVRGRCAVIVGDSLHMDPAA